MVFFSFLIIILTLEKWRNKNSILFALYCTSVRQGFIFFYYPNNMIQLNSHYYISKFQWSHFFWHFFVLNLIKLFILFAIKSEFVFNHSGKKKLQLNFEIKINFSSDLRYTNIKALSLCKCDRYKRVPWKCILHFLSFFMNDSFPIPILYKCTVSFRWTEYEFRSCQWKGKFWEISPSFMHFRFIEPEYICTQ